METITKNLTNEQMRVISEVFGGDAQTEESGYRLILHVPQGEKIVLIVKAAPEGDAPVFPKQCKTWEEIEEIKRKYCKPTGKGPKGQLCYDLDEVSKYIIFPKDESV